jgi:seryl-tRNA synthetase
MHSAAAAAAERSIQKLRQEAESAHAAVDAVTHTATSQCAAADQIESALEQIENVARKLEVAEETTRHRSEALLELCLTIQQPNSVAPSI